MSASDILAPRIENKTRKNRLTSTLHSDSLFIQTYFYILTMPLRVAEDGKIMVGVDFGTTYTGTLSFSELPFSSAI